MAEEIGPVNSDPENFTRIIENIKKLGYGDYSQIERKNLADECLEELATFFLNHILHQKQNLKNYSEILLNIRSEISLKPTEIEVCDVKCPDITSDQVFHNDEDEETTNSQSFIYKNTKLENYEDNYQEIENTISSQSPQSNTETNFQINQDLNGKNIYEEDIKELKRQAHVESQTRYRYRKKLGISLVDFNKLYPPDGVSEEEQNNATMESKIEQKRLSRLRNQKRYLHRRKLGISYEEYNKLYPLLIPTNSLETPKIENEKSLTKEFYDEELIPEDFQNTNETFVYTSFLPEDSRNSNETFNLVTNEKSYNEICEERRLAHSRTQRRYLHRKKIGLSKEEYNKIYPLVQTVRPRVYQSSLHKKVSNNHAKTHARYRHRKKLGISLEEYNELYPRDVDVKSVEKLSPLSFRRGEIRFTPQELFISTL